MKSFRWILLLLLLLTALPNAVSSQDDDPIRHVLRIYHRDIENGMEVVAENLQGADLTVDLELHGKNVVSDPPAPVQFILGGRETRIVARVRRANPRDSWRCGYSWHWCYGRNDARHDNSTVYQLPYPVGTSCLLVQGFHGSFSHTGQDEYALDFGLPEGAPILACRGGLVMSTISRFSEGAPKEYFRNRVNSVRIKHDDGTFGEYCHFRHNGVVVQEGDRVEAGDLIGYTGHTGYAAGPHLHFLVYRAVDGHHREGFPIVFQVAGQSRPIILEEGQVYRRP